jgi:hypothetical protein
LERIYDIFEQLPNGSRILRACAKGLESARPKLEELAAGSENEFYAIHVPTKEIVARTGSKLMVDKNKTNELRERTPRPNFQGTSGRLGGWFSWLW